MLMEKLLSNSPKISLTESMHIGEFEPIRITKYS